MFLTRAKKSFNKLITRIVLYVFDADAVSSYPSNIMAANVSKDTTHREIISIEGVDKTTIKLQVVNSVFGSTNASEFCEVMFNMYDSVELLELAKKEMS